MSKSEGARTTGRDDGLCIVMPVYNEQASIQAVVDEWSAALEKLGVAHRFLILNDGSRDRTGEVLDRLAAERTTVDVIHKSNSGHGQTCIQGYREAIVRGARWVFQIDSDGQCDPRYFSEVWRMRESHAAVIGRRTSRDDGLARTIISWFCRVAVFLATSVWVPDPNVPYRLMRTDVLEGALEGFPSTFGLANILVAVVLQKGLGNRLGWVSIGFRDRTGGEPSVKWTKFVSEGRKLFTALSAQRPFIAARAEDVKRRATNAS